jgi:hypothetical protein
VETSGIFGYSVEPYDYCAVLFLAIIVSRYSREEDWVVSQREAEAEEASSAPMYPTLFASQ